MKFKDVKELERFYKKFKGLTIGELRNQVALDFPEIEFSTNKGIVGQVLEGLIGNAPNSNPNPDVENLGIELKVLPLRKTSGKIQPKERSKIKSLNYSHLMNEHNWEGSAVRPKVEKILFFMYEQPTGKTYKDWKELKFKGPLLFNLETVGEDIVIKDWRQIKYKVDKGMAMELSEGDGVIMGACTSGTGKVSTYGPKNYPCKQRSYSLKHSFLKTFYSQEIQKKKFETSEILNVESDIDTRDILLMAVSDKIAGKSLKDISLLYAVDFQANSKSGFSNLIKNILGVKKGCEELTISLMNLKIKTVPINQELTPWEAMSFPKFSLVDLLEEEWDDTNDENEETTNQAIFRFHIERPFLFIPIIKNKVDQKFESWEKWKIGKPVIWQPSNEELDGIKKEWYDARKIVEDGVEVEMVPHGNGHRQENNLIKQTCTKYIHIRPHALDSKDVDIPFKESSGVSISWQSFWFNKKFVKSILKGK